MPCAAQQSSLPTPLTFIGHPPTKWGHSKYYKIKLRVFEDPGARGTYAALFEGSTYLFEDLDTHLESAGPQALATLMHVRTRGITRGVRWHKAVASYAVPCCVSCVASTKRLGG